MSSDKFNDDLKQDINASERNRLLFVISITLAVGSIIMPHDYAVATIATKYIFPAAAGGMCFGISIYAAIDLWKDHAKSAKSSKSNKSQKEGEAQK